MPNIEQCRFAVLGSGALGGLYGAMLARAGHEVHFLLRSDYDHISRHGWKIESHYGDFELPEVLAHESTHTMPACDVTIVSLKTTQNHLLPEMLRQTTKDGGLVLVLQNGLHVEEDAAAIVGPGRVLGGCCFLCSNKVGPGHIRHLDYGRIAFGEFDVTARGERAQNLRHLLSDAGIDAVVEQDLHSTRWRKLMWNIPFNGLSVVLNASTKDLVEDSHSLQLAESLMAEVHHAANSCGANIPAEAIQHTIEVTKSMVPYDSSMRIDFLNQSPMEVEYMFGNPIRSAAKKGVSMPQVEMLYQQLKFIDSINGSTGSRSGEVPG